jgi:hypothetical protein
MENMENNIQETEDVTQNNSDNFLKDLSASLLDKPISAENNSEPEPESKPEPEDSENDTIEQTSKETVSSTGGTDDTISSGTTGEFASKIAKNTENIQLLDVEQEFTTRVNNIAHEAAVKDLQNKGIKTYSINDLWKGYNPETGEVDSFNPENPNIGFESKQEALLWLQAHENYIKRIYSESITQYKNSAQNYLKPELEMAKHINTIKQLDDDTKDIVVSLLKGKELIRNGKVIGFSTDIGRAIDQAKSIINKFKQNPVKSSDTPQEPAPKISKPSVDIPSKGSAADTPVDKKVDSNPLTNKIKTSVSEELENWKSKNAK